MPKRKKPHFRFKKHKTRLKSELEHLKEMKSRPCPGPSMHGRAFSQGSVSDLLDAELVDGVVPHAPRMLDAWSHAPPAARLTDQELDAIDEALQGPEEAPALAG